MRRAANRWVVLFAAGCGGAAGTAATSAAVPSALPASLQPAPNEAIAFVARGVGAQVYACRPGPTGAGRWTLVGVHADLLDGSGRKVGRHVTGPAWEHADGSRVAGEKTASVEAPAAGAVPWLLLRATQTSGRGVFGSVSSVVRADTVGGKAPDEACDSSAHDVSLEVPYQAVYSFYRRAP